MKSKKPIEQPKLTDTQIREQLQAGLSFQVANDRERRDVLNFARCLGIEITTKRNGSGYQVKFVK